jgi:Uma2 family endonuclease
MSHGFNRKFGYSDLVARDGDGKRYELVDGELLVNPAPSKTHQRISRRLQRQLENYFHTRKLGEVFDAPFDVILTPHDVFEPDLLVVGDPADTTERGVERPPLLVVEILSPSTRKVDRGKKFLRYGELGVLHCWIVDPDGKRVECYRLESGRYRLVAEEAGDTTLNHPDWSDFKIDLEGLWSPSPFA